jgi:hypothetical protein
MTENELLRALPLEDRLRIAAVDLAITGAPRVLVVAVWEASEELDRLSATVGGWAARQSISEPLGRASGTLRAPQRRSGRHL